MSPPGEREAVATDVAIEVSGEVRGPYADLAHDVREGFARTPRQLSPKYLYDERGSQLFEQITEQPEYYPTRAEREILRRHGAEIAAATGASELVELGSGAAVKTRLLIEALRDHGTLRRMVCVDISPEITLDSARRLDEAYPSIDVRGLVCDFAHALDHLPAEEAGSRLIALLGGTIGNFDTGPRERFVAALAERMAPGDQLLLGTDLVKDRETLEAAYNDRAGVTAQFTENLLCVLNRELDADFDLTTFRHVASWDADNARMDIRLRSLASQRVRFGALDMAVDFAPGEEVRTELSCKFTRQRVEALYAQAGLRLAGWYTDPDGLFAVSTARRA